MIRTQFKTAFTHKIPTVRMHEKRQRKPVRPQRIRVEFQRSGGLRFPIYRLKTDETTVITVADAINPKARLTNDCVACW